LESYGKAVQLIQRNLESLEIRNAELIHADVIAGLEKIATRRVVADFIFVDPPYEKTQEYGRVLDFLDGSDLIAPRGVVIVEHYFKTTLPMRFDRLERVRVLEQGDASLSFFRLAAAA
jgi:16S rRNA G966 N2-methylase RsmD